MKTSSPMKLRKLKNAIAITMRNKGIVFGDVPNFDSEYRSMRRFWKKSKHSEALAAANNALAILNKTKVDKAFVRAKMVRFNHQFDKLTDEAISSRVWTLSGDIMKSFESGKYEKANNLINQAFQIMGSR